MSDRHAMRYLTPDECRSLGLEPCSIYGSKVHSLKGAGDIIIPHGTRDYGRAVAAIEVRRRAA